ncbi:MAG: hypothetical protein ACRC62_04345 [Microcoleus sp.]
MCSVVFVTLDDFVGEARLLIVVRPNQFTYFVDVVLVQSWGEVSASAISQKVNTFDCAFSDKMPAQQRWNEAIAISKQLFPEVIQKYTDWSEEVLSDKPTQRIR